MIPIVSHAILARLAIFIFLGHNDRRRPRLFLVTRVALPQVRIRELAVAHQDELGGNGRHLGEVTDENVE